MVILKRYIMLSEDELVKMNDEEIFTLNYINK